MRLQLSSQIFTALVKAVSYRASFITVVDAEFPLNMVWRMRVSANSPVELECVERNVESAARCYRDSIFEALPYARFFNTAIIGSFDSELLTSMRFPPNGVQLRCDVDPETIMRAPLQSRKLIRHRSKPPSQYTDVLSPAQVEILILVLTQIHIFDVSLVLILIN